MDVESCKKTLLQQKHHTSSNLRENISLIAPWMYHTKETQFYSHYGNMYVQIDVVTISSLLGVLFINFKMRCVESHFQEKPNEKTSIVVFYIDIFLNMSTTGFLPTALKTFRNNSVSSLLNIVKRKYNFIFWHHCTLSSETFCNWSVRQRYKFGFLYERFFRLSRSL